MNRERSLKISKLSIDWRFCAEATARNLGFTGPLNKLPAEQWQKVLTGVEAKMRLKGTVLPEGWQVSLEEEAGRSDG